MTPIVALENITYTYPDTEKPSLKDINLTLEAGEFVLLVGPSGCGKTTLLETIAGVIPHAIGGRIRGKVMVDGVDTLRSETKKRGVVGLVLQDPESQLTNLFVEDEIAFGPENLSWPKEKIRAGLEDVLAYARLSKFRRSFVYALSGGQKQRVSIAAGLIMHPRVLLMDGPTTNLDPIGADEVLQLINRLKETGETEAVMISANKIDALLPLATRIVVMDRSGGILLDGDPQTVLLDHLDELRELGIFVPELAVLMGSLRAGGHPLGLARSVDEAFASLSPLALKLPVHQNGRPPEQASLSTASAAPVAPPLIQVQDVHFGYNRDEVLHGVTLEIRRGEALAIVGHNGSGKTTLMKLLAGLLLPTSGSIRFLGKDTREMPVLGRVGYVFQYPEHQFVTNTVIDELMFGFRASKTPEAQAKAVVDRLLQVFGLADQAPRSPYLLSMGEKRRLSVATMLTTEPEVLILDEPTTGMDRRDTESLMALLDQFVHEKGITVIQVSHDMEQVAEFATRVVIVDGGLPVLDCTPEQFFHNQEALEQFKLAPPPVAALSRRLWPGAPSVPITVREFLQEVAHGEKA